MFDVITVGSATVDVFAVTQRTGRMQIKTLEGEDDLIFYPLGEKLLINKLKFSIGGGGTNTSVAMSRLGLKTAFLGKMGLGQNSKLVARELKKEKVSTALVVRKKPQTGYSIILDAAGEDRTILAFKGSNNQLRWDEVVKSKLKTKWFYFSSMLEESLETQIKVAKFAEKEGIKIAYNPSSYLCREGRKLIGEILKRTEVLILNKEEAEILLGLAHNNMHSVITLIKELMCLGPKNVVITDGKKGAYTIYDNKYYAVKPKPVKVVETTGAGDAFASTFIAALIKGVRVEVALQLAVVNAQSVIKNYGAKNILLDWNTARKEIKKTSVVAVKKVSSVVKC